MNEAPIPHLTAAPDDPQQILAEWLRQKGQELAINLATAGRQASSAPITRDEARSSILGAVTDATERAKDELAQFGFFGPVTSTVIEGTLQRALTEAILQLPPQN